MSTVGNRILPSVGQIKDEWFDPARSRVDFVVLYPGIKVYPGFTDRRLVVATFGKPSRVYHVGKYTILWWPKNLLTDIPRNPRVSPRNRFCLVQAPLVQAPPLPLYPGSYRSASLSASNLPTGGARLTAGARRAQSSAR